MTVDRTGQPWTREETLTAFVLYMHIPRGLFHAHNKDIIALAQAMGRRPSSVARKLSNIEHFDPNRPEEVIGSANGSHWERDLWGEMQAKGDQLVDEAVRLYRDAMSPMVTVEYTGLPILSDIILGRDIETKSTTRLNQDHFRNMLMWLYEDRCCVSGLSVKRAADDESDAFSFLWNTRGRRIQLPERHKPSLDFITYHQDVVFRG